MTSEVLNENFARSMTRSVQILIQFLRGSALSADTTHSCWHTSDSWQTQGETSEMILVKNCTWLHKIYRRTRLITQFSLTELGIDPCLSPLVCIGSSTCPRQFRFNERAILWDIDHPSLCYMSFFLSHLQLRCLHILGGGIIRPRLWLMNSVILVVSASMRIKLCTLLTAGMIVFWLGR